MPWTDEIKFEIEVVVVDGMHDARAVEQLWLLGRRR